MNKLKAFFEQLRNLDPNDPGRWPFAIRLGTTVLLLVLAAGAGLLLVRLEGQASRAARGARQGNRALDHARDEGEEGREPAGLQGPAGRDGEILRRDAASAAQQDRSAQPPGRHFAERAWPPVSRRSSSSPQGENRKDFYAELPIRIRLTGGYHEMGAFASGIAALPRIVTLHDIEITPASRERGTAGGLPADLVLDVTAKTYRYLDEEEQAAAQPEAAAARRKKKG